MVYFRDHPEFRPNLTPREIFRLGSFGGTYWRSIYSHVTGRIHNRRHIKYQNLWFDDLESKYITTKWSDYDKNLNKYKVRVGTTLEFWEGKKWINKKHPYGWVEWYCAFYSGVRSSDDERQIKRWLAIAGDRGRFRTQLINLIKKKHGRYNDAAISPKIRQTLQHWGYKLTKRDCEAQ
jgi:hypothetical protein